MFGNFTELAQKILVTAKKEMQDLKHPYVGSEHLLLGILKEDKNISEQLKKYNLTYESFKNKLINIIGKGSKESEYFLYTPLLKRVLETAIISSREQGKTDVTSEELLMALLEEGDGVAIRTIISMEIDINKLYEIFAPKINTKTSSKRKMILNEIAIDLTEKAEKMELDPVIGREEEVKKVMEILCRRIKNNPLIIGEAGVGKTSIVEEIARLISTGKVPRSLKNKRIYSLDMASAVGGTKYRGEFEERMKKIIKEVEDNENIIIFIDEIHTVVGAGGAEGAIDAANILKPALARGKLRLIGATTISEYNKYIENDKALERRFQKILVEEPSEENVINILNKIKKIYESFHNVIVEENIIKKIVTLSKKYIPNRKEPDRSIDILDEVCTMTSLKESKYEEKLKKLYDHKNEVILKKRRAVQNYNFKEAYNFRSEEEKLENEINNIELNILNKKKNYKVSENDVIKVIEFKSGVPISVQNKNKELIKLEKQLKQEIIGQDNAIKEVINLAKISMLGYKNENRPFTFLFAGTTGVGKTALAKAFGTFLVGEKNIIKLDMSEYSEPHTISKIIGSPPGYTGYQDQNTVINDIKNKPNSVIILDEFDKAHKMVKNLFLQAIDEGMITDSSNNKVSIANSNIIITGNINSCSNIVGFEKDKKEENKIKEFISPEILNRIDKVIMFNKIDKQTIEKIVNKELLRIKKKYSNTNIKLQKNIINKIIEKTNYEEYGARKVSKVLRDELEVKIIDNIINNKYDIEINELVTIPS